MKKIVTAVMATVLLAVGCGTEQGTTSKMPEGMPTEKSFDQTDGVLARARAVEDIEYKIMVQRATQTAIYYMPAVVMVDFIRAIRRDLGGEINDVASSKQKCYKNHDQ